MIRAFSCGCVLRGPILAERCRRGGMLEDALNEAYAKAGDPDEETATCVGVFSAASALGWHFRRPGHDMTEEEYYGEGAVGWTNR